MPVHVHQVPEESFAEGRFLLGQTQGLCVELLQFLFLVSEQGTVELSSVSPTAYGVHRPVIEDGCTSVLAREALAVHTLLAQFLAEVYHHGVGVHQCAHQHHGTALLGIACEEVAGYALLVVVLQEVEHVILYVLHALPA